MCGVWVRGGRVSCRRGQGAFVLAGGVQALGSGPMEFIDNLKKSATGQQLGGPPPPPPPANNPLPPLQDGGLSVAEIVQLVNTTVDGAIEKVPQNTVT